MIFLRPSPFQNANKHLPFLVQFVSLLSSRLLPDFFSLKGFLVHRNAFPDREPIVWAYRGLKNPSMYLQQRNHQLQFVLIIHFSFTFHPFTDSQYHFTLHNITIHSHKNSGIWIHRPPRFLFFPLRSHFLRFLFSFCYRRWSPTETSPNERTHRTTKWSCVHPILLLFLRNLIFYTTTIIFHISFLSLHCPLFLPPPSLVQVNMLSLNWSQRRTTKKAVATSPFQRLAETVTIPQSFLDLDRTNRLISMRHREKPSRQPPSLPPHNGTLFLPRFE